MILFYPLNALYTLPAMFALPRYVLPFCHSDRVLLYEPINGNAIILPSSARVKDCYTIEVGSSVNEALRNILPFSVDWKDLRGVYESPKRLYISLELFLSCNLACPYCYQRNNNHSKGVISKYNLDLLYDYIVKVYQAKHISALNLKILGGEPSVDWTPGDYVLKRISAFCNKNNIRLDLYIDTNGTNIDSFIHLEGYTTLTFNIPLCHKKYHDQYRSFRSGQGTYDTIIENANTLARLPNTSILLRHNTDTYNAKVFGEYLHDLRSRIWFEPLLVPFYTTDPIYGEYKNVLPYYEYVLWRSSTCVDYLLENGFNISYAPRTVKEGECQQASKYSLKLFSNGRVGACAVNFYDEENPQLSKLVNDDFACIDKYWNGGKRLKLFRDFRHCKECQALFTCLGDYHLPCVRKLGLKCDPHKNVYFDFEQYFIRLLNTYLEGNAYRFKSINIIDLSES